MFHMYEDKFCESQPDSSPGRNLRLVSESGEVLMMENDFNFEVEKIKTKL